MAEIKEFTQQLDLRRERKRVDSLSIDKEEIVDRVHVFYTDDLNARDTDVGLRLQRYAKYRMWTEGRDWIGEETSDVALPDMITTSLRMQDTLHNAVMSQRPVVQANALQKSDKEKQETVDNLIDYQFFVEQKGEKIIEEYTEAFVNDPAVTIFVPWVREQKKISDIRLFSAIPEEMVPAAYFNQLLEETFNQAQFVKIPGTEGWDWNVLDRDGQEFKARFYTRDDNRLELVFEHKVIVFDGPRPMVKDYDHILCPPNSANLQAPGPSNPGGASHVILMDFPTVDEIKKLAEEGFYDLVTDEELEALGNHNLDDSDRHVDKQKDDFAGTNTDTITKQESHRTLTRLVCFDNYDIDGDGFDEDVIWWVILETRILLKAKSLTEMYPANPPRRPFAEASFLPVKGRRAGISFLELMEGTHDWMKQTVDLTMDSGTITTMPFGFYKPDSNIKQEVMRLFPGELYPLRDPTSDINIPTFNNNSQAFGFNMLTLATQFQEKLTTVGDLQLGRVPQGKASALRTAQGMQTILGQGEARPERILRRYFMGLTELWAQIHELNQHFLPEKKKFRLAGFKDQPQDPYTEIEDRRQLEGRFTFSFAANVFNTSKQALQEGLNNMLSVFLSPLGFQMGMVTPDNAYRLMRDWAKAFGQDPALYLTAPSPQSEGPTILAEEAISQIMNGKVPFGEPMEGAIQHLEKLQEFLQGEQFGLLDPEEIPIFQAYFLEVKQKAEQEQQQQQLQEAAAQLQPQGGGPGASPVDQSNPQIQNNELLAEDLPSSGGGGAVR